MKKYIGADIGGTSIKLGIVDEHGRVECRREINYPKDPDINVLTELICGIRAFMEELKISPDDISGIGVSAAGCINSVDGCVADNGGNIPNWSRMEVCRPLREEFGVPASFANDGNCAVMGEFWNGAAKGYTDVVGVILGTGIGGGIITGGRLLEGSRGFAGEVGHFPIHAGGTHCNCGLDGCYERYASTSALTNYASRNNESWSSGRRFFEAVSAGDEDACRILDSWTDEIAYGIAGLVHVFDPQLILVGGGVSGQKDLLMEPLRKKVLSMIMPDFADGLEFKAASLGNNAGLTGAVYYLLSRENASDRL
ncbi:MAG: ROK family protein [Mogibacterium sp.]|nr:ROK family protein [Mogibacterium sp.]